MMRNLLLLACWILVRLVCMLSHFAIIFEHLDLVSSEVVCISSIETHYSTFENMKLLSSFRSSPVRRFHCGHQEVLGARETSFEGKE